MVLSRAVPIEKSHRRDTMNALRSRFSMRQPSVVSEMSSGSSYTSTGSSDSDDASDSSGEYRRSALPENSLGLPAIRVGGINNGVHEIKQKLCTLLLTKFFLTGISWGRGVLEPIRHG